MRFSWRLSFLLALSVATPSCDSNSRFKGSGVEEREEPADRPSKRKIPEQIPEGVSGPDSERSSAEVDGVGSLDEVNERCEAGDVKTVTQEVVFAPSTAQCQWGQDDNLPLPDQNLIFTARNEQSVPLEFPQEGVLCDLEFNFDVQEVVYDDEIILTLNDLVLASSQDYADELMENGDYLEYDWAKLKGAAYRINSRDVYCVGAEEGKGACFIPPTQQRGKMELKLDGETVKKLGVASGVTNLGAESGDKQPERQETIFKLITLGDNDQDIDCQHSGFEFSVSYHFVTE